MNGAPAYSKTVTLGDQEVSATDIEIGPAAAALKIVIGTKNGQVGGMIAALPAEPMGYPAWSGRPMVPSFNKASP